MTFAVFFATAGVLSFRVTFHTVSLSMTVLAGRAVLPFSVPWLAMVVTFSA
ncbi:hypothetical protein D3C81_1222210 [compost metagenome]